MRIITFKEEDLYEAALRYFIRYSGLDLTKPKHRRMMEMAHAARLAGLKGLSIRAAVSVWDGDCLAGGSLKREGSALNCPGFSRIPDGVVRRIYAFVVTAGECLSGQEDPVTVQLFAHNWGTAYVDVARDALADIFSEDARRSFPGGELQLSAYFGPGFYGMPMTENQLLCRWLSAGDIGVSTRENGLMLPLKSSSGLYLATSDLAAMPSGSCEICTGNPGGCAYCIKNRDPRHPSGS